VVITTTRSSHNPNKQLKHLRLEVLIWRLYVETENPL